MKATKTNISLLAKIAITIQFIVLGLLIFFLLYPTKVFIFNPNKSYIAVSRNLFLILFGVCYLSIFLLFYAMLKRQKVLQNLVVQSKLSENIINQSHEAIITSDFDLNIISWNTGAQNLYGFTAAEALGQKAFDLIPTEATTKRLKEVWQELKTSGNWKDVVIQHSKTNNPLNVLISLSVIKNKRNRITGFIAVCSNITAQKELEKRTDQLSYMIESSNDAMIIFNQELKITYWNRGAERLYGYAKQETTNQIFTEFLAKQYSSKLLKGTLKNLTEKGYWKSEDIHYKKNGTPINVFVSFTPYINKQHREYIAVITDITDQKTIEQKLILFNQNLEQQVAEKTAELREIFDRVDWGFVALNKKDEYVFINPKAGEILKRTPTELMGKNIWNAITPHKENRFSIAYQKAITTQKTEYVEYYTETLQIWVASYIFPSPTGVSIYFRDITEKKKLQEDIVRMNKELRQLATHAEQVLEKERKRVAGELHDELGQSITSIKIDADWLHKRLPEGEQEAKQKVQDIIQLSVDTAKKIRTIAQSLRPSILDDMGVIAAIEWQLVEFKNRTGIKVNLINKAGDIQLNEDISINLFRVIQESLTNISRHAQATVVTCKIELLLSKLIVSLQDDGVGFIIDEKKNTFGLMGIRERIKNLGGKFTLLSQPGNGTKKIFEIPL